MNKQKKEIEKVDIIPYGSGWGLKIVVKAGVYGVNKVGFDFGRYVADARKILSVNQVKEVIAELERRIIDRGAGNVPPEWRDLLRELTYGKER
jgi:hypothetical protein